MSRTFTYNSQHVAERKVRNEVILIPVSSKYGQIGTLFDLNEMAALVWEKAKTGESEAQICQTLSDEFDASADEIASDVKIILDELIAFGALTACE